MTSVRRRLTRPKRWNVTARKEKKEGPDKTTPQHVSSNHECVQPLIPLSPLISTVKRHLNRIRNEERKKAASKPTVVASVDGSSHTPPKILEIKLQQSISPRNPCLASCQGRQTHIKKKDGQLVWTIPAKMVRSGYHTRIKD